MCLECVSVKHVGPDPNDGSCFIAREEAINSQSVSYLASLAAGTQRVKDREILVLCRRIEISYGVTALRA